MTAALIISALLNVALLLAYRDRVRAASFWRRNFESCHALFMAQLRSEHGRYTAELRDALIRARGKRRAEREWN